MFPAQLVKLRHGPFVQEVLEPYRNHIAEFWTSELIDQIVEDHRDLLKFSGSDQVLRTTIDQHDIKMIFDQAWDCVPGRFARIRAFCGGLATVFANTKSIESNFSTLKWKLGEYRTSMMHISVEGVFQAKQRALRELF